MYCLKLICTCAILFFGITLNAKLLGVSVCVCVCVCVSHSVMSDSFVTRWTVTCQAPLSMEFSRQGYWSGLPFTPPGDLPDPGIELESLVRQADSLPSEPPGKPTLLAKGRV